MWAKLVIMVGFGIGVVLGYRAEGLSFGTEIQKVSWVDGRGFALRLGPS